MASAAFRLTPTFLALPSAVFIRLKFGAFLPLDGRSARSGHGKRHFWRGTRVDVPYRVAVGRVIVRAGVRGRERFIRHPAPHAPAYGVCRPGMWCCDENILCNSIRQGKAVASANVVAQSRSEALAIRLAERRKSRQDKAASRQCEVILWRTSGTILMSIGKWPRHCLFSHCFWPA
jgi:hypothetical protein